MFRRLAPSGLLVVAVAAGCGPSSGSTGRGPAPAPAATWSVGRAGEGIVVEPPGAPVRPFGWPTADRGVPRVGSPLVVVPPAPGGWRAPLVGSLRVTRPFEPPANPYGPGHRGVDLAAPVGTPVLAAGAGTVTYAAVLAGRGVVVVSHGTLRTTYEPVRAAVHRGDRVAAGRVLGWLVGGHPGCPAAACLHWGLLSGSAYLDPLELLRRTPPRLLPLLDPGGRPLS